MKLQQAKLPTLQEYSVWMDEKFAKNVAKEKALQRKRAHNNRAAKILDAKINAMTEEEKAANFDTFLALILKGTND